MQEYSIALLLIQRPPRFICDGVFGQDSAPIEEKRGTGCPGLGCAGGVGGFGAGGGGGGAGGRGLAAGFGELRGSRFDGVEAGKGHGGVAGGGFLGFLGLLGGGRGARSDVGDMEGS